MIQKQSELFSKTMRAAPAGEESANAILLERGGFVYKNSAGVYTLLPLGWRVIDNIATIIREEMNAIGGQELFMPALVEKSYWQKTKRWDVEIGFEVSGKKDKSAGFILGWSHEDLLTDVATRFISSYKDLPLSVYQIQTKFRNEPRAKSGMLRGREFLMKDLYSFHASEEDLNVFYNRVAEAYKKIFERCGVKTYYTLAAGGDFTINNTHEFQTEAEVGEDKIMVCQSCEYAENTEISKLKEGDPCPKCSGKIKKITSIEVGNIFPLGTKYADAVGLKFTDDQGGRKSVVMGSYGIGLTRLMGTMAEIYHDEQGLVWPAAVAPYDAHVLVLGGEPDVVRRAEALAADLEKRGLAVLYDDRMDVSAGEKFSDRDLIGIPKSIIVSEKGRDDGSVEIIERSTKENQRIKAEKAAAIMKK